MTQNPVTPQLDPKLKEAYERVMGTSIPSVQAPAMPTPIQSKPTNLPSAPSAVMPTASPMAAVYPQTPSMVSAPVGVKAHSFVSSKKGSGISPIIIVLAATVFFLVYALFWIKFFGVTVPFLP